MTTLPIASLIIREATESQLAFRTRRPLVRTRRLVRVRSARA